MLLIFIAFYVWVLIPSEHPFLVISPIPGLFSPVSPKKQCYLHTPEPLPCTKCVLLFFFLPRPLKCASPVTHCLSSACGKVVWDICRPSLPFEMVAYIFPAPIWLVSVPIGVLPLLSLATESGDGPRQGLLGQQKDFFKLMSRAWDFATPASGLSNTGGFVCNNCSVCLMSVRQRVDLYF